MAMRGAFVWAIRGVLLLSLSACSGLVVNHGERDLVVEHDFFISRASADQVASKSCAQSGRGAATFVSSTNKNPSLPAGQGVQLSRYICG